MMTPVEKIHEFSLLPNPKTAYLYKNIMPIHLHASRTFLHGTLTPATLTISNGKIQKIIPGPLTVSDTNPNLRHFPNAVLMPGAIDPHVHINDPGRTHWEGFATATAAAATGGITTLVDMPLNSSPVTTNLNAFNDKIAAGKGKLLVNVGLYAGLVPDNLSHLESLLQSGVLGIKCFLTHSGIDEFPNVIKKDLQAAMPLIVKHKIPLLAHCELTNTPPAPLPEKLDPRSYTQYLHSRPKRWENEAVQLMINLCRQHNCTTHIVHVSSAEALPDIARAKAEKLPLTAETCPHYLYFYSEQIQDGNTRFKCAPPIRSQANNEKLKQAFQSGILDFLATDHSPAPPALKEIDTGDFTKAWGGISSLQYLIPAAWTSLKDHLTLEAFIPLLTAKPAAFLGIADRKGSIEVGMDADLTVWSPETQFTVQQEDNQHRHKISPYTGHTLFGKINATFVNGVDVFNQQLLNHKPGQWILKNKN